MTSAGMRREGSGMSDASARSQPQPVEEIDESPKLQSEGAMGVESPYPFDEADESEPSAQAEPAPVAPSKPAPPKPAAPALSNPFSLKEDAKPAEPVSGNRVYCA